MVDTIRPSLTSDVIVRLQIFSGRPDPTWKLSEPQVEELTALISALHDVTDLKPPAVAGRLDYRGFVVTADAREDLAPEQVLLIHGGIIDRQRFTLNIVDKDNTVELFLLSTAPPSKVDPSLLKRVKAAVHFTPPFLPILKQAPVKDGGSRKPIGQKKTAGGTCRPQYDPHKWDSKSHISTNHCYNYATDVMKDNGAIPGEGGGTPCCSSDNTTTCESITNAAILDLLKSVANTAAPPDGHYVALAVQPAGTAQRDFHFYRRDCNGFWSHKVGKSPVSNLDNSNNPITDPSICDRGTYTVFCGYFSCDPTKVKIGL